MSEFTLPFGLDHAIRSADWTREVSRLYNEVRSGGGKHSAWDTWCSKRNELMAQHPNSPLEPHTLDSFTGLSYFDHRSDSRVLGTIKEAPPISDRLAPVDEAISPITRVAVVTFELYGASHSLDLFWIGSWKGGLFLPFADKTSGQTTYGGGRYLLDTMKGEDLGLEDDQLVLDFNFAYNPRCAYNPNWSCPLAGPGSRIDAEVRAGERYPVKA